MLQPWHNLDLFFMCYCCFVLFSISWSRHWFLYMLSHSFPYSVLKRSMCIQKLFIGRPAWVHIDKWWICSNSCFHNEVKWNVKCSKVRATPVQKIHLTSTSRLLSSNGFLVVVVIVWLCVSGYVMLGQTFFSSRSIWFLIMF